MYTFIHYKSCLYLFILIIFLNASCSTTEFNIIKEDIEKIHNVLIVYEKGKDERPEKLIQECSNSIRKVIIDNGMTVKELHNFKTDEVTANSEIKTGFCSKSDNSDIDAVMFFKIPEYREEKRIGFRHKRFDGFIPGQSGKKRGAILPDSDKEIIEIKTFHFKIQLNMMICSTGESVLKAENTMTRATNELEVYESMDDFTDYILGQLVKELKTALLASNK